MTAEQLHSFYRNIERKKAAQLERLSLGLIAMDLLLDWKRAATLASPRAVRRTAKMQGQAAGLNSLVALALMGSTVSVATRWVNSVSALVLAVKVSNCLRA
jgi:hypothetical protein